MSTTRPVVADYWETRYRRGQGSGSGSRGTNAARKAGYVNRFISDRGVKSVVDWGCGDGVVLRLLDLDAVRYTGIDVAPAAVARCILAAPRHDYLVLDDVTAADVTADLALSLDVIQHLTDDRDYHDHLTRLFRSAGRFVVIHATDHTDNANSAPHVRHRRFTADIADWFPNWRRVDLAGGVNGCVFAAYQMR